MKELIFFFPLLISCNFNSKNPGKMNKDSKVFEKKDSLGRVIEKWGNYGKVDNNMNFRFFYYYDQNGLLVGEKKFFFDDENTECLIMDSAIFDFIKYTYKLEKDKYALALKECTIPDYDSSGNYIGRRVYYIQDAISGKYIYEDPKTTMFNHSEK